MSEIKYSPYKNGYCKVTDGYTLYYELYGNPEGIPILFLHGGPGGSGIEHCDLPFFDHTKWNILVFDQRGAGKSTPFAGLYENNTPKLISDINALLEFHALKKVFLYGGSWGSTLSLFYAIQHTNRILGMILRGIYLGNSSDNIHLIDGPIKYNFPEYWGRFMSFVPQNQHENAISYYLEKMLHGNKKEKDQYAYEFAYYENAFYKMQTTKQEIENHMKDRSYRSFSPIEATYMVNTCFMPDNYILDNAPMLSSIPVTIVHGRYDFICPPRNAWELHKKIKESRLHFVFSGHTTSDKEMSEMLTLELKRFSRLYT